MKWGLVFLAVLVLAALTSAEGEIWEEDEHEVLIRSERGTRNRACRYVKGQWSECDPKTNMRTRTLTLKKGDQSSCEQTKTIQKKCKKACRYEKGTWDACDPSGQMVRVDSLKSNSDSSCEQSRQITKKCKSKGIKNKAACKYEKSNEVSWSSCSETTGVVTKSLKLVSGDPKVCPKEKLTSKKCQAIERRGKLGGRRNRQFTGQ